MKNRIDCGTNQAHDQVAHNCILHTV